MTISSVGDYNHCTYVSWSAMNSLDKDCAYGGTDIDSKPGARSQQLLAAT